MDLFLIACVTAMTVFWDVAHGDRPDDGGSKGL
jgi:hypothetical protein